MIYDFKIYNVFLDASLNFFEWCNIKINYNKKNVTNTFSISSSQNNDVLT